jgi:hypothetical protein
MTTIYMVDPAVGLSGVGSAVVMGELVTSRPPRRGSIPNESICSTVPSHDRGRVGRRVTTCLWWRRRSADLRAERARHRHSANGEPARYAAGNSPGRSSGDAAAARSVIGGHHLNPEQDVFTGRSDDCGERDRYLAGGR